MEHEKRVWPYVLPFPVDVKQRRLIWRILQSKVGTGILSKLRVEKPTYQKELIEKLPYSNKSIIEYLKLMASAGILEQGMKRVKTKRKTVWIKFYKPTRLGKWLILFLKSPEEVSKETAKETIEELFQIYSANIVEVCQKYGLDVEYFHQVLDEKFLEEWKEKASKIEPDVVVFGSVALDVYGQVESLPKPDETVYVTVTQTFAGGMGANVAVALSRLEVPVAFVGKIGSNSTGRFLLRNLKENNVDISNVKIERQHSLQALILFDPRGERYIIVLGFPNTALSISSPNEINWELVKKCKMVYIGEVFVEMASTIANFAKNLGKTVLYRPGVPYLKLGIEGIKDVLEHVDIFIMNEIGWKELKKSSLGKIGEIFDLCKLGPKIVILTKGEKGCEVWTQKKRNVYLLPKKLSEKFKVIDPTGAGDSFSAALIKKLLDKSSLEEAVHFAQVAACITCSRMGASPAFPTYREIMEIWG